MKQTLQLRMGQQLTMTPQLQQAIKLLQLSSLDLQQEIQQVLDSNMMLETADDDTAPAPETGDLAEPPARKEEAEFTELPNLDLERAIPQELPVDSSWDEVYDNLSGYAVAGGGASSADNEDFAQQKAPTETLQDHLHWQMELTQFSDQDYAIATAIIDSINEDGYLTVGLEEIHQGLESQLPGLELDEIRAVLHRVQNFEPVGVAALDLADCLCIQLRQLPEQTPWRREALALAGKHLDLLAKKDLNRLKKTLDFTDEALTAILALIRTLEPKPGRLIASRESEYITPDVYVFRQNNEWVVTLNPEIAPKLRINSLYSNLIRRADNSADNTTMKNHLQEARWFIKSLQSRNKTLLRVARSIVERQKEFLEHGETAMKPLVLRDIAEEVEMHESTISRVTTQKYIHTPNGIYEFKYFFSSHVQTEAGGECSATAIKAFLKEMVEREDSSRPLSDLTISALLREQGIHVARRTIAKYREALNIPSSNDRKKVF